MYKALGAAAVLLTSTSMTFAGGIDRSGQSIAPLFEAGGENGAHVRFSIATANPEANATGVSEPLDPYTHFGFAYKEDITDNLSAALIIDDPFGADVDYPLAAGGLFAGGNARVDSNAISGLLRYKFNENFSVHGGIRAQKVSGQIASIALLIAESGYDVGYSVGAAYEVPEIALRVAFTYHSEIDNDLSGTEDVSFGTVPAAVAATEFTVTTPASYNLDFQTGIAEDTLLFGNIRYVEWDGFNLTTGLGNYVNFTGNTTTYNVGVGRRFSETLSGAISVGYEAPGTRPGTTPLAPTTGSTTLSLGGTYTMGNMKIAGGITYGTLGDQTVGPANFNDNSVIGGGLRVSFDF